MTGVYLILEDPLKQPNDPESRVNEPQKAIGPLVRVTMESSSELLLCPAPGTEIPAGRLSAHFGALKVDNLYWNRWSLLAA